MEDGAAMVAAGTVGDGADMATDGEIVSDPFEGVFVRVLIVILLFLSILSLRRIRWMGRIWRRVWGIR